jgi:hypothetical protein
MLRKLAGIAFALLIIFAMLRFAVAGFSVERFIAGCGQTEKILSTPLLNGNWVRLDDDYEVVFESAPFCSPELGRTQGQLGHGFGRAKNVRQVKAGTWFRYAKTVVVTPHGLERMIGGHASSTFLILIDNEGHRLYAESEASLSFFDSRT